MQPTARRSTLPGRRPRASDHMNNTCGTGRTYVDFDLAGATLVVSVLHDGRVYPWKSTEWSFGIEAPGMAVAIGRVLQDSGDKLPAVAMEDLRTIADRLGRSSP